MLWPRQKEPPPGLSEDRCMTPEAFEGAVKEAGFKAGVDLTLVDLATGTEVSLEAWIGVSFAIFAPRGETRSHSAPKAMSPSPFVSIAQ